MPFTRPDYLPLPEESCVVSNQTMWKRDALLFESMETIELLQKYVENYSKGYSEKGRKPNK